MPLDPRIQAFLEQTEFLTPPGNPPREPQVLLAELRAASNSTATVKE